MIALLVQAALAQDLRLTFASQVLVDPLDPSVPIPVHQVDFSVQRGAAGADFALFELSRIADHRSAGAYRLLGTNQVLAGATLDVMEPDPAQPGVSRVARRFELDSLRVQGWSFAVRGGQAIETVGLGVGKYRICDYAWPGPVQSCAEWNLIQNQESW